MLLYQFHFLDGCGGISLLDLGYHADDDAAGLAAAGFLKEHDSATAVEVYDANRLVCRCTRPPGSIPELSPPLRNRGVGTGTGPA